MNELPSDEFFDQGCDYKPVGDRHLPIHSYKEEIIEAVKKHQFVIIKGSLGCGKSTQVPRFLYEEALHDYGVIGITHPRKVGATTISKTLALEMEEMLGNIVGYHVRFNKRCGTATKIKYMTDRILVNACFSNYRLKDYQIIIIDEVHERSVMTDLLLGLLKLIVTKRSDLKVIISSATIAVETFVGYFAGFDMKVISMESHVVEVEVIYHDFTTENSDCIAEILGIVKEIHDLKIVDEEDVGDGGDVLVFLTGQNEINRCCDALRQVEGVLPIPLYRNIGPKLQKDVFAPSPAGQTKVVVATNIAESSITIKGVKYVIDCGFVKQKFFNSSLSIETLEKVRISKVEANQRKGRAGRTQPGVCHRLYSEKTFQSFRDCAIPEIFRKNLTDVYIRIKALDLNPEEFAFIDQPDREELNRAKQELIELGLLTLEGILTDEGRIVAQLPVEPVIGKVIMTSLTYRCTLDVIYIICMFQENWNNIFIDNLKQKEKWKKKRKKLFDNDGDHFSFLKIYKEWFRQKDRETDIEWCAKYLINNDVMESVQRNIGQMTNVFKTKNIDLHHATGDQRKDDIRKCFVGVYFRNISTKQKGRDYYIWSKKELIHVDWNVRSKIIMFNTSTKTTKSYANGIMCLEETFLRTHFAEELKVIEFLSNVDLRVEITKYEENQDVT